MKNIIQALVFILIGAALYYFVAPQFEKSKQLEQYVFAPQVFLNALESQTNANLDSLQKRVESIALQLTQPKANISLLTKALQTQLLESKEISSRISAFRSAHEEDYLQIIKGPGVPVPPPPPPPCKGCEEWRIRYRDPIVIYSRNPIKASILDNNGKELISSTPGSASQQAIGSNIKISLKLPDSSKGKAILQLEDNNLKNIAKMDLNIQ